MVVRKVEVASLIVVTSGDGVVELCAGDRVAVTTLLLLLLCNVVEELGIPRTVPMVPLLLAALLVAGVDNEDDSEEDVEILRQTIDPT